MTNRFIQLALAIGGLMTVLLLALSTKQGRAVIQDLTLLEGGNYCVDGMALHLDGNFSVEQVAMRGKEKSLLFGYFPVRRELSRMPFDQTVVLLQSTDNDNQIMITKFASPPADWQSMVNSCKTNAQCSEVNSPFILGTVSLRIKASGAAYYQHAREGVLVGVFGESSQVANDTLHITNMSCRG